MAIINYTDQLKYAGKGYLDSKMMPVKTYDDLKSIPLSQRFEGFTVVVLNDGNPQDYWLVGGVSNSCWTPKTATSFDELKLVLEDGFLKLMNAEVELGEAVNLNDFFPQGGEDSGNSNDLYIESVDYTDKDADDNFGIFMCFTYSDGTKKYLNMSQFLSQTYAPGNGIVIDGNVISIDSAILGKIEAFEVKIETLENKTEELTSEIANKVTADEVSSIISEQTEELFNQIANKAEKSDLETIGNEIAGVKNIVNEEKVVREEADANLQNELNQIKDDLTIVVNDVDSNKKNISTNSVEIAALKERVNALSSNAEGSTPDGKTIGVTDDEQKALYVKVLNKDGNILSVESDNGESGLCAFIPFYCEDKELMEE